MSNRDDPNEFKTYNYKLIEKKVIKDIGEFIDSDLDDLIDEIKNVHNDLYELFYDKNRG